MECYVPYDRFIEKRNIITKGNYLLKASCCDDKSCQLLESDIQDTRFKCNDLFRSLHEDNLDEKGNILTTSMCSELKEKQNKIASVLKNLTRRAGRRNKRKIGKKKYNKTKKYRNRRYKR